MLPKSLILVLIILVSYISVSVLVKQFPEKFYNIRKVTIGGIVLSSNEASKITVNENHFYVDNQLFIPRGVFYQQPQAYRQWIWDDLNVSMLDEDFRKIKNEGFNTIHLSIPWGSFMPSIDLFSGTYTRNLTNEQNLITLIDKARAHGLFVVLFTENAKVPEGIDAKHYPSMTDACGVQKRDFYGYLVPCLQANSTINGKLWQLFIEFHKNIADLLKEKDNIIWDPVDWQHLMLSDWTYGEGCNLNAWRTYLETINSDINYWNNRWNESNSDWNTVVFPIDKGFKDNRCTNSTHCAAFLRMYVNVPVTKNQTKWDDFRKYQNELLINNTRDIANAIKSVDTDALIGQRVDIWRYGGWIGYKGYRNETWGAPGVDFIFCGEYSYGVVDKNSFQGININTIKPSVKLPIYAWETGSNTAHFTEEEQKNYLTSMVNFVNDNDLMGFGIWWWRDSCFLSTDKYGLLNIDNTPKSVLPALVKLFNPPGACSDGTAHEHCLSDKPRYCYNGNFVDNCTVCDCPSGYSCQASGSCSISSTTTTSSFSTTTTTTTQTGGTTGGDTTGGGTTGGIQTTSTTSYTATTATSSQTTTTSSTSEITTATSSASPISFSKIDYTIVALALTAVIAPILIFVFIKTI